jgi:NAD(P)-dependent dehydrogenase (short-subunit alcohol dehydrogenase family)
MAKPLLSYNVSKAAINAATVQFANELRGTPFKINAADPGYTATRMTSTPGHRPTARAPEEAAQVVVRLATLPADGPTGCFFDANGPLPW